jgi:DNA (cytosine-5)-methyltransferase 1
MARQKRMRREQIARLKVGDRIKVRTWHGRVGVRTIIENIMPAKDFLHNPFMLCGTMFDLGVFRHRLFETNFPVFLPAHSKHTGRIGDGKYNTVTGHAGGSSKRDGWKNGGTAAWQTAMGIDWMTGNELKEAIPPAYTKFIGEQLLNYIYG